MVKRCIFLLLLSLGLTHVWASDTIAVSTLTNCLAVTEALQTVPSSPIPFDIRATVTVVEPISQFAVIVQDKTGATWLNSGSIPLPAGLRAGMLVRATGKICIWRDKRTVTDCKTFEILGEVAPLQPTGLTVHEANDPRHAARLVRLSGQIRDLWIDDTDPRFAHFVLADGTDSIFGSVLRSDDLPDLNTLIGAEITVCGTLGGRRRHPTRPYMSAEINVSPVGIAVVRKAEDLFAAPTLESLAKFRPHPSGAYLHCRTCGRVLAAWNKRRILLSTERGENIMVSLLEGTLPVVGTRIEVVGIPVINPYRASLVRAIWRPTRPAAGATPTEETLGASLADILTDGKSRRMFNIMLHGRTLRITGEVRNYDPTGRSSEQILIHQDGLLLPVHIGDGVTLPDDLAVGCIVSVTGICILDTESWGDNSLFPAISSCSLVLRTDEDLKILRQPPWWTPSRVRILVLVLLGVIALAAVWIILLRRLAEQRARTLAKETVAHAEAALKVYERSRLAVELHDTISQNLTGAVWQIRSARPFYTGDDGQPNHLDIALKTIDSCRGELKNCIWDLRNDALEKTEVDEAIRLTLRPIITDPALGVRFNVPRERLSDSTLHTILSVIREFASNGVRHGKATEIRVAGAIEGDKLLFSVRDNGCGFVPSKAPGMDDGHFGLQGVRERLRPLGGTLTVDSQPGRGCKCTVSINLPQPSHS